MRNSKDLLATLKRELEFLDKGGYRTRIGWRQPLFCMESGVEWKQPQFFEDSPICQKKRYGICAAVDDCALKDLVPVEHRQEAIPCRHLPLNEKGDTLESLYRIGTHEQMEAALRSWLLDNIGRLEQPTA